MPGHNFAPLRGRLQELRIDSAALRHNRLGDPHQRSVMLYLPEGYEQSDDNYPLFVSLAPFTGSGLKQLAWQSFGESLPQRIDRLIYEGRMGPVIVAFPDGFTSLGGNQYLNSPIMGDWEHFLNDEMIARIESEFRVRRGRQHRAIFGRSSGGYASLIYGMRHASHWGAIASHSGDVDFDLLYRRDFPKALDALAAHDGKVDAFLKTLAEAKKIRGDQFYALMLLAMAATYDPAPMPLAEVHSELGIRLPVDLQTCTLDPEAWNRWCAWDPLHMVDTAEAQENLRQLAGIFIDCGSKDQYFLHYGNRALVRKLNAAKIDHQYEEFPDGHSGIDYRYDRSLPFLYDCLTKN